MVRWMDVLLQVGMYTSGQLWNMDTCILFKYIIKYLKKHQHLFSEYFYFYAFFGYGWLTNIP